ncbi:hypothetical protein CSUI_010091, partial [Cystoisospora suis]
MAHPTAALLTEAVEHSFAAPPTERRSKRNRRSLGLTTSHSRQRTSRERGAWRAVRTGAIVAAAVASMTYALRCVMPRLASPEGLQGRIKVEEGMSAVRRLAARGGNGPRMPPGRPWRGSAAPGAELDQCGLASLEEPASMGTQPYLLSPESTERPELPPSPRRDGRAFFGPEYHLFGDLGEMNGWHFLGSRLPALELDEMPPPPLIRDSSSGSDTESGRSRPPGSEAESSVGRVSAFPGAGGASAWKPGSAAWDRAPVTRAAAAKQTAAAAAVATPGTGPTDPFLFGYFSFSPSAAPVPLFVPEAVLLQSIHTTGQTAGEDSLHRVADLHRLLKDLSLSESTITVTHSDSPPVSKAAPAAPSASYSAVVSRGIQRQSSSSTQTKPSTLAGQPQQLIGAQAPARVMSSLAPRAAVVPRAATRTTEGGSSSSRVDAGQRRKARSPLASVLGLQALRSSKTAAASPGVGESREGAGGRGSSGPRAAPASFGEEMEKAGAGDGSALRQTRGSDGAIRASDSGVLGSDTDPGYARGGEGSGFSQRRQLRKKADRTGEVRGQSPGGERKGFLVRRGKGGATEGAGVGVTGGDREGAWCGGRRQVPASPKKRKGKVTVLQGELAGERGGGGSTGGKPSGG